MIAVEGQEVTKVREIHHALEQKGWGADVTFTILRDGLKKEIAVTLPSSGD